MLASRHDLFSPDAAAAAARLRGPGMSGACIVVAGAGDVGGRLAALRLALGEDVVALRRGAGEPVPGLRRVQADLATGEGLARLPRSAHALVFCAAPDQRDERAYRALYLDGLRRAMDACTPARVLFVSSTAVYGQNDGSWVDEHSVAVPEAFNGRVLREAEQALESQACGVALRLSGIYGPGRESMLHAARRGDAGEPRWTNRIHVQDAATALSHLLDLAAPQTVYLGSDDLPALHSQVVNWVRELEGLPAVPSASGPERGRRVRNARLRASGWAPVYPDYRQGYLPLLSDTAR
jgi:electron-transferring-flavoprotein dehydrogenase